MKLNGKVAVVTAATSGIGLEIAQTFAREGARVVVADLNLPQAQAAAEEIGKVGPKAMGVAMDVADELAATAGLLPPYPSSAPSTCSSATPASRSCSRSRISPLAASRWS